MNVHKIQTLEAVKNLTSKSRQSKNMAIYTSYFTYTPNLYLLIIKIVPFQLWNTLHKREQVVQSLRDTLHKMGLNYIDLYLMHWPIGLNVSTVSVALLTNYI